MLWTDAAGATRWIAAILRAEGSWYWTRIRVPELVWSLFLERQDDQLGMQEFLAIPLAVATFEKVLMGTLVTAYIDIEEAQET